MLLLHMSDIHFRRGEVDTQMDPNAHLRNELVRDAADLCKRLGAAPEAILISGDLAFAAHPDEYAFARKWLEALCRACKAELSSVFVCPGNHDVLRDVASRPAIQALHRDVKRTSEVAMDGLLRGLLTDPETKRMLYEPLAGFNAFAYQFFCDLLPPDRTHARRDLKLNDGSILRLTGLNSALISSASDKPGDLFVDPASFQLLREHGVEHLVLCHHPYSWLREGPRLNDHLNDVARIHLFGHEHTNRIELGLEWVRVAASAAHPDRTERGWEPGYNAIEVAVEGTGTNRTLNVDVHVRVWQERPGEFRAKTYRGSDVFRNPISLDAWEKPEQLTPPAADGEAQNDNTDHGEDPEIVPVESLRNLSIRFFDLTSSQKASVAGKLNLIEDEDSAQPEFERYRRALLRAGSRDLIDALASEIAAAEASAR